MASRHSHDAHLGVQRHAVDALDGRAHMLDEALQVGGTRTAVVDDEVRVLLRHRRIADAKALEARRLDQARGVITRRIGEHRAAAPLADRLRLLAPRQQRLYLAGMRARTVLEVERGADEPLFRRGRAHRAVTHLVFARLPHALLAVAIDGLDAADVTPGI